MLPALYQHTHVPSVNTQTQSSSIIIDHHRSLCASPLIARRVARTREPVIRRGTTRGGVHLLRGARARGDGGGENAGVREHRSSMGRVREWRRVRTVAHRTPIERALERERRHRIPRSNLAGYDPMWMAWGRYTYSRGVIDYIYICVLYFFCHTMRIEHVLYDIWSRLVYSM